MADELLDAAKLLDGEALPENAEPPPELSTDLRAFGPLAGGLVLKIGNAICRRANVTELTEAEAGSIGDAVCEVAAHYDFTMDPKIAAWFSLAVTVGVVVDAREKLPDTETEASDGATTEKG